MNSASRRIAATLALLGIAPSSSASAETLREAIAAAYATNPVLAEARARQDALSEAPEQERAAGRLTAQSSASGGYSRFGYDKGADAAGSASLPIWSGGRVRSAVRAAQGDVAAGAQGVRDTEAFVLEQVVATYADLLYAQQAVAVTEADIELLDRQVAEAQARYTLGQSTRTDVAQLRAQRDSAVATLADAQRSLASVAADYRAQVGHDPQALEPRIVPPAGMPGTLDEARLVAIDANPLVARARAIAAADAARIDRERAERAPSVSLGGDYGYGVSLGTRSHAYENAAVAGVTLRLPLLTGGLVASRVRQAKATYRADGFAVASAEREATRNADAAWAALAAAKAQGQANDQRVAAAQLALDGVRAEYAYDLRSTLDILVADESLRSAQLALARSRSDLLIAQANLLRAIGRLDSTSYADVTPTAKTEG